MPIVNCVLPKIEPDRFDYLQTKVEMVTWDTNSYHFLSF